MNTTESELRVDLINRLHAARTLSGNEGTLKKYLVEQLERCRQLANELREADTRTRREASAKLAQDIVSLRDLLGLEKLPQNSLLADIFGIAYSLAFPVRNQSGATWKELQELTDELPEVDTVASARSEDDSQEVQAIAPSLLDQIIENSERPLQDAFDWEIAKLTREQLEQLVVAENVYDVSGASASAREFLEIGAAETSWRDFFEAYRSVMCVPSDLDPAVVS